jgi:hypothetical protein
MNSPDSAISTSRQLLRLASTLASMISLSQDVISPDRVISRPTVNLRTSPLVRRDWVAGSPGRRIGSAGRIAIKRNFRVGVVPKNANVVLNVAFGEGRSGSR